MRFSLLALNDTIESASTEGQWLVSFSEFIAHHNVSCICINGCLRTDSSPPLKDRPGTRADNAVAAIVDRLADQGFKSDFVWAETDLNESGARCGVGIVSQLHIIGSHSTLISTGDDPADPGTQRAILARLGVSPVVSIDVVVAGFSDTDRIEQLRRTISFVDGAEAQFTSQGKDQPRRRGRPPRKSVKKTPPSVRIAFLSGVPESDETRRVLLDSGFSPAVQSDPSVYMKPAIRPTDHQVSSLYGSLYVFEV